MQTGNSIIEAEWLVRTLVEHRRATGSEDAFADVAKAAGLPRWSAWVIYYKRRKSVGYGVLAALRREYLRICEAQVVRLVAEMDRLKESGEEHAFTDLGTEVLRVAEKVRQARERHRRE